MRLQLNPPFPEAPAPPYVPARRMRGCLWRAFSLAHRSLSGCYRNILEVETSMGNDAKRICKPELEPPPPGVTGKPPLSIRSATCIRTHAASAGWKCSEFSRRVPAPAGAEISADPVYIHLLLIVSRGKGFYFPNGRKMF